MTDPAQSTDPSNINVLDDRDKDQLWSSRRKMAWVSLWGIIVPTIFIILKIHDPTLLEKIGNMMSWYYVSLASIVGAYVGFTAWASIKGIGKSD